MTDTGVIIMADRHLLVIISHTHTHACTTGYKNKFQKKADSRKSQSQERWIFVFVRLGEEFRHTGKKLVNLFLTTKFKLLVKF